MGVEVDIDGKKFVVNCATTKEYAVFDDIEDIKILSRLLRNESAGYVNVIMHPDALSGYIEVIFCDDKF